MADSVENSVDSGSVSYSLSDTDSDLVADFKDLDSDNDTLFDIFEAEEKMWPQRMVK